LKRVWSAAFAVAFLLLAAGAASSAVQPVVVGVDVTGNQEVISEHILGVIGTKAGDQFNPEQVQQDIDAIYGLGFFSFVDVNVVEQFGGVFVEFKVQENPIVRDINFTGNTVFTADQLMEVVFTRPGAVFNRVFFRHDLQRIGEKYEKAGYVLVRVEDVGIQDGIVNVKVLEPKIGNVIIQGNKKTKTEVIRREFKLGPGDLFNATILRHSLNKLNQKGFFEDVNIGLEPTEDPSLVNVVLTVQEGKTARVGLSIGHGSESGWSGGVMYEELNYRGLGHRVEIGFETGDREQYWLTYIEPYMDENHYSWRVGAFRREWENLRYYIGGQGEALFDEEKQGFFIGAGKKFRHDPNLSWFLTLDWHEVNVDVKEGSFPPGKEIDGKNFSITGTLARNRLDPYLSYPKGDYMSLSVEQGLGSLGGDWDYTKYWFEARYYWQLYDLFKDFLDREIGTEDNPVIFATRLMIGYSTGDLPWAEQYFLGGANSIRGYRDDEFYGNEMVLGNFELRIPIQDAFSVVAFYDIGMASDDSAFSNMKTGYGFGVRVRTPMGHLRLDVGTGEYETRTHFSFGEMF